MNRTIAAAIGLGLMLVAAVPAATIYTDRTTFESQLGTKVTDDFTTAYPVSPFAIYSNVDMSAFLGETRYESTEYFNLNILTDEAYCAGCNGSFRLTFTSTSVSGANGVFGVGMDLPSQSLGYALVTYGDNSTEEFVLPPADSFWGITSALEIQSIHIAETGGTASSDIYVQIDNLTIGNAGEVPEPGSWALLAGGLGGLALLGRKRQAG